ncbi:hypothetical protein GCM10009785_06690 [Brooklawnia cerclae]
MPPVWELGPNLAQWTIVRLGRGRLTTPSGEIWRTDMGKGGRKRRARRKGAANHGKRPNA